MTLLPMQTLKAFARRLACLQSRAWLPPALLLLALSSIFLLGGGERSYFKQIGLENSHDQVSAKNLAIVDNLSLDNHLLMFVRQTLDADGKPTYDAYNRFPIGSYALVKLAILPFGDNLSAKIYVARMLMLLFFAAAAVLAYASMRRIAASRWIALTATLLAFSSAYFLHYKDVISGEVVVDLFAVMLVFHGMVIFEQEGRFRQLPIKACIALLLGWHVYALLLPFIALGLMREIVKTRMGVSTSFPALCQLKHATLSLLRSRYLTLGVIALLFGISTLSFNFTNEYFALNRETPLTELPSFRSMTLRTGLDTERHLSRIPWSWTEFSKRQFHRIGAMSLPYAFIPSSSVLSIGPHNQIVAPSLSLAILGIAVSGASLIALLFVRGHTILLATLTLSGFCWALPMRHNTELPHHNFEAVFYIGVTLTLFLAVLLLLRRLAGERLIVALSVAALLVFVASTLRMSQINADVQTAELRDSHVDLENIRNMTDDENVIQFNAMSRYNWIIDYYLSGRILIPAYIMPTYTRTPDFVVTGIRLDGLASLTPQNQTAFLYEWEDYHTHHIDEIIEAQSDEPLTRHGFDVYLVGNNLIYVKDACREDDVQGKFFLALYPVHQSDLPDDRKRSGFNSLDFFFEYQAIRRGERCIAIAPLPEYDIAHIYTGKLIQRADSTASKWAGQLIDGKLRRIDEIIKQTDETLIRSVFDAHLSDKLLIYSKDACQEEDIREKFFLALFPVDESELPDDRKPHGFDNLDFRFQDKAILRGERCIAIRLLPGYDIARIHTGQVIQRADGSFEHLWEGEIHLTE